MRDEQGLSRRWGLRGLLLAYPLLLIGALLSHSPALSAGAGLVLISLLLWPALVRRSRIAIALWLGAIGAGALLAWRGHTDWVLLLLPVAINAALAGLFARTLRTGERPLIARAILAIEGEERLALPGIAGYARRLTLAWSLLLASLALLLLFAALFASPEGILESAGIAGAFGLPRNSVVWAGQLGVYLAVAGFFAIEFAFRLWHFRHLPHPTLREFVHNLAKNWQRVLHDAPVPPPPSYAQRDVP
ncbi:MAG: xanthomonadin biosynthesis protein [Tahibacter sp.]